MEEIEEIIGLDIRNLEGERETGEGIADLLEQIIEKIPAPTGRPGRAGESAHHRLVV